MGQMQEDWYRTDVFVEWKWTAYNWRSGMEFGA
jgi:hypothetical protein